MGMATGIKCGLPSPEEYDGWLYERISNTPGLDGDELMKQPVIPGQNEEPRITSYHVCYTKLLRKMVKPREPP